MFVALSVRNGKLDWSPKVYARAVSDCFLCHLGFRTVFQFPADLACNWLLQLTESRYAEIARRRRGRPFSCPDSCLYSSQFSLSR